MFQFLDLIQSYLETHGLTPDGARFVTALTGVLTVTLISLFAGYIARRLLLRFIKQLIERSKTDWDDLLIKRKVLDRLFFSVPVFVFYLLSRYLLSSYASLSSLLIHASAVCIIVLVMAALESGLDVLLDIYYKAGLSFPFPVKSVIQVLKVFIYLIGGILIISTVIGKTPVYILSGMGALTAVLMLVFKDPILGLVAGIQLTRNDMVRVGDWIEMTKYGADGTVIDLALTTVKVRNFDNTVTTVPTYALISDSFRNWRYMSCSGGRRIKRSFFIDMNTVKFCSEEMLCRFSRVQYISEYITRKKEEINKYNEEHKVNPESVVNGRRMTNLGILRAYMEAYLRNHPMISKELTLMVRQLEPTPDGLPIQVYCFSVDKAWMNYEAIQSDIYDHLIAVVPEFDLRLFQNPTGSDFTCLSR
ncbi:MAG: mechanosensitive ion channel [Kiritimatiellia bacterium]